MKAKRLLLNLKLILLFSLLLLASCKKDDYQIEKKIVGKWNWLESNGGFTGNAHYTPENTGEKRQFIFHKDRTLYIISNTDTIHITNYSISREKSILFGEEFDFITINFKYELPDTIIYLPMRYMIRKITDELELDEDVYDGFRHRYERIKN